SVRSWRTGTRACSPVGMVTVLLPVADLGTSSDQLHVQVTLLRELLMTMSCFSTVSPARKLWSLLVKPAGLPAMYASSGWLLRTRASAAGVATQSVRARSTLIQPCRGWT